jgi:hypothetical protein
MREVIFADRIIRTPEEKRPLERPRCRWKGNIIFGRKGTFAGGSGLNSSGSE